ncbi:MAG: phosphatase PAP2 family protein [Treponema sp.]|jgi:undecaprenyl-diphosphatase|nr:phosphatase PAP2 family protein [Treponema sp.]
MEALLQWGLECIRAIQTIASPPLTVFMKAVTFLGTIPAYLILIPLIYWCVDEKKAFRLGMALMISAWVNLTLKYLLDQPRPFFPGYDPAVALISESHGGFPSGHAQNSLVLAFVLASWGKKKLWYAAAAFFTLLIGFSRLYLGVHFPTDLFGGWVLGGIILTGYFLLTPNIEKALARGGLRPALWTTAAAAFIMILYRPSESLLMPGAVVLGMGAGYSLVSHYLGFTAGCQRNGAIKFFTLLIRFMLGITVTFLIFVLSAKLEPKIVTQAAARNTAADYSQLFVFIRYGIIAFWISAGAPWLFIRLKLANSEKELTQDDQ